MGEPETNIAGNTRLLRRRRMARSHVLEQFEGQGAPREFVITEAGMVMGRANDADIHLGCTSASRHHATVQVRGTDCIVTDNGSRNGIFLNAVRIHSAVLRDGDVLRAGDCAFVYFED